MANPTQPPDPPPSISAAELRRRLLASTPPPLAGPPIASIETELMEEPKSAAADTSDLLSRLRLPSLPATAIPQLPPEPTEPTVVRPPSAKKGTQSALRLGGVDSVGLFGGGELPPPAFPQSPAATAASYAQY